MTVTGVVSGMVKLGMLTVLDQAILASDPVVEAVGSRMLLRWAEVELSRSSRLSRMAFGHLQLEGGASKDAERATLAPRLVATNAVDMVRD